MATKTYIQSDLSGAVDASTVEFGFDGKWYVIDLTAEEKETLAQQLGKYIAVARKAAVEQRPEGAKVRRLPPAPQANRTEREEIREWANKNGFEVPPRGRIEVPALQAYFRAHPKAPVTLRNQDLVDGQSG